MIGVKDSGRGHLQNTPSCVHLKLHVHGGLNAILMKHLNAVSNAGHPWVVKLRFIKDHCLWNHRVVIDMQEVFAMTRECSNALTQSVRLLTDRDLVSGTSASIRLELEAPVALSRRAGTTMFPRPLVSYTVHIPVQHADHPEV